MKKIIAIIFLFAAVVWAGSPVIWEGQNAKLLGTGQLLDSGGTSITKDLVAGTNITLDEGSSSITITASGGGGGATTALDNLAAVAINADLVHGTVDTDISLKSKDNGAGASGDVILGVGTATTTEGDVVLDANVVRARVGTVSNSGYCFVGETNRCFRYDTVTDRLIMEGPSGSQSFFVDVDGTHVFRKQLFLETVGTAALPALNFGSTAVTPKGLYASSAGAFKAAVNSVDLVEFTETAVTYFVDILGTFNIGALSAPITTLHTTAIRSREVTLVTNVGGSVAILNDSRTSPGGTSAAVFEGLSTFKPIAVMTQNNAAADAQNTPVLVIETGNITNAGASGNTGNVGLKPGTNAGSGLVGEISLIGKTVVTVGGFIVTKVTGDPCGDTDEFPEAASFYNDTSNYYCYCDGTNDVQMHDPSTACF